MKTLLINNDTKHINELKKLIPDTEVVMLPSEVTPEVANAYDLVVLSGSSTHAVVWDRAQFLNEEELIHNTRVPIIGICFGCELIAHSYGASIRRMEQSHEGVRKIRFVDAALTETPLLSVYEHHRWVIETLPADFEVLARSNDGIEAFRHRHRKLYGLQFHPEVRTQGTEAYSVFLRLVDQLVD